MTNPILQGKVVKGEGVGRQIGFPTANLKLAGKAKIKPGVHAALIRLNRVNYLGLAYYGRRFIFNQETNSFEVYLFNFSRQIYSKTLKVSLLKYLRPPKKIDNLLSLKKLLIKDVAALNDQVILVDQKDRITGITDKAKAHLGKAKLHRAISVQLFNQKGELLIQKRAKTKKLFAGKWANTVCTDVRPYETYFQAAGRRLKEEMGLYADLRPAFKLTYTASWGKNGSEREIDQVFFGRVSVKPKPNPGEVADWKFISLDEAMQKIATFAPWFQLILKRLNLSDILKS